MGTVSVGRWGYFSSRSGPHHHHRIIIIIELWYFHFGASSSSSSPSLSSPFPPGARLAPLGYQGARLARLCQSTCLVCTLCAVVCPRAFGVWLLRSVRYSAFVDRTEGLFVEMGFPKVLPEVSATGSMSRRVFSNLRGASGARKTVFGGRRLVFIPSDAWEPEKTVFHNQRLVFWSPMRSGAPWEP